MAQIQEGESTGIAELIISILLATVALAGVVWIVLVSRITTVDGLFMSLILLTIAGIFGLNILLELRQRDLLPLPFVKKPAGKSSALGAATGGMAFGSSTPPGTVGTLAGIVESIRYFEAPIGEPNKSIVIFRPERGDGSQMMIFCGNVQNQLSVGKRVEISYRTDGDCQTLLNWK